MDMQGLGVGREIVHRSFGCPERKICASTYPKLTGGTYVMHSAWGGGCQRGDSELWYLQKVPPTPLTSSLTSEVAGGGGSHDISYGVLGRGSG